MPTIYFNSITIDWNKCSDFIYFYNYGKQAKLLSEFKNEIIFTKNIFLYMF